MKCRDLITQRDMEDYLRWAVLTKDDAARLSGMFSRAIADGADEEAVLKEQSDMLFVLYNEFASIERLDESGSVETFAKTVLSSPYRYCRKGFVRDGIVRMSYSDYGNPAVADLQFEAVDASMSASEKAMLDKYSFFSVSDSGEKRYSRFFVRLGNSHAPIELKRPSASSPAMPWSSAAQNDMDPIALASYVLNESSDADALRSVLKKIRSGTIN